MPLSTSDVASQKDLDRPFSIRELGKKQGFYHDTLSLRLVLNPDTSPSVPCVESRDCLKILSYNVRMMAPPDPPGSAKPLKRAEEILRRHVDEFDVIVFNEVYYNLIRGILFSGLEDLGFKDATEKNTGGSALRNTGNYIISKYTFEGEDSITFDNRVGDLTMHDMGVTYASFTKKGRTYHVFATHLQHDEGGCEEVLGYKHVQTVRNAQLREIKAFMDEQTIGDGEPVIIAGDMNTAGPEYWCDGGESYYGMLNILGAKEFRRTKPTMGSRVLDHILYTNASLKKKESKSGRITWHTSKFSTPYDVDDDGDNDLSDHHPVMARFVFE